MFPQIIGPGVKELLEKLFASGGEEPNLIVPIDSIVMDIEPEDDQIEEVNNLLYNHQPLPTVHCKYANGVLHCTRNEAVLAYYKKRDDYLIAIKLDK